MFVCNKCLPVSNKCLSVTGVCQFVFRLCPVPILCVQTHTVCSVCVQCPSCVFRPILCVQTMPSAHTVCSDCVQCPYCVFRPILCVQTMSSAHTVCSDYVQCPYCVFRLCLVPIQHVHNMSMPILCSDYVQCPYCSRRFNQQAAERHINFCKEQSQRINSRPPPNAAAKAKQATRLQVLQPSLTR